MKIPNITLNPQADENGQIIGAVISFNVRTSVGEQLTGDFAMTPAEFESVRSAQTTREEFIAKKVSDLLELVPDESLMLSVQEARSKVAEVSESIETQVGAVKQLLRKVVKITDVAPEELAELIDLYDEWQVGVAVEVGDILQYQEKLFKVIQAHTTQADWTPDTALSLFVPTTPQPEEGEIIPVWVQPTGAHDAYQTGDKVIFNDKVYQSKIDANAYSPEAYPQGWELIDG